MALFSRTRSSTTTATFRLLLRHFSILFPHSSTPLTSHQKSRAAISLLRSETNPELIVETRCAASLTPAYHLDRIAFSVAISKLTEGNHFRYIDTFLHEFRSRPDLQNERSAAHSLILYGQAKMLNNAFDAFDDFYNEGFCRSAKSLNALLVAALIARGYKEVKRIFVEFPKRCGIEPDIEVYNAAIKALCESRSSSAVYSILVDMKNEGVKPTPRHLRLC